MKKFLFILFGCWFSMLAYCQSEEVELICLCDKEAEFPGGMEYLQPWLDLHSEYPEDLVRQGVEGRVYVTFICNEDGSISNVNIVRGLCPELDQAAITMLRRMPKWTPYQHGCCCSYKTTLLVVIHFDLI